jgi:integrase/recombinase XerD
MASVEEFLLEKKAIGQRKRTIQAYQYPLLKFRELCPNNPNESDVYRFMGVLRDEGCADRTVFNHTQRVLTYFKRNGVVLKVTLPDYVEENPSAYTLAEIEALLNAANDRRLLFRFFLGSGGREQEVCNAEWSDIDFAGKLWRVTAKADWKPKTWEERCVPLDDSLLGHLTAIRKSSGLVFPTTRGGVEGHALRTLKQIAKRAGLDPDEVWLHKFRATFATMHSEAGVPVPTIQRWLGHKDMATTMRYLAAADIKSDLTRRQVNLTFGRL